MENSELSTLETFDKDPLSLLLFLEEKAIKAIDGSDMVLAIEACKKAEDLVEALQAQGSLIDPDVVQVILHNSAMCHQSTENLDKCLMYLDACAYNCKILKSLKDKRLDEALRRTKYLSKVYLQICSTYAQLGRHAEALKAAYAGLKYSMYTIKASLQCAKARNTRLKLNKRNRTPSESDLILLSQVQQVTPFLKAILKVAHGERVAGPVEMRSAVGLKGASEWIESFTISDLMTLQPMSSAEFKSQGNLTTELSKDYVMIKLSLVVTSFFCIATELKSLSQEKAYDGRNPREAEAYHKRALELARSFYPFDCPLRKHIEQTYRQRFFNILQEIPERPRTVTPSKKRGVSHSPSALPDMLSSPLTILPKPRKLNKLQPDRPKSVKPGKRRVASKSSYKDLMNHLT